MTAAVKHRAAARVTVWLMVSLRAASFTPITSKVPAPKNRIDTPMMMPMSPTRLVKKALRAASELSFSSHQWPMSTNEHTPTSSQPTSIWMVVEAVTKKSIDAVNRLRNAKKWV